MAASLHVLPSSQLQDIPTMLRRLASDMEDGLYGRVTECAVVTKGAKLDVFGFGAADGMATHYLLGCGMAKLQARALGK